jgi:hypothetical protein
VAEDLSTVLAAIEALRSDVREDLAAERQSRKDIHERLGKMENTVAVDVATAAQSRDKTDARLASIEKTLAEDVKPPVEEFKRMKMVGLSVVGLVGIGGTAFGASIIWWGEQTVAFFRWLFLRSP